MRTGIFSDIHGNDVAFAAVVADLERESIDRLVCLGDVVQGGPQPADCIRRLQALDCRTVMGNADAFVLDADSASSSPEQITDRQLEVRAWTLEQLGDADRGFLASFPPTVELDLGNGASLLAYHGSPRSYDDVLLPETPSEEFAWLLGSDLRAVMAGGHVHLQFVRRVGDSVHLNPGSVGLAYDREQPEEQFTLDPWAEYAIVTTGDGGALSLEFRRVPFEVEALLAALAGGSRPHREEIAEQWRRGVR